MNPGTIIALAAVGAALGLAVFLMIRRKRRGGNCSCGCGNCPGCDK